MRTHHSILVVLLAGVLSAQDKQDDGFAALKQHFAASETLLDVRWGFDPKLGLLVRPNPKFGGDRADQLTPYLDDGSMQTALTHFLQNSGAAGFMALVLFGDQDLVSHCFADYHFRRMGLDRSVAAIRARIGRVVGKPGADAQLDQIHRLLAVRIAQRRGLRAALPELEALSKARGVDLLLRWAADDAIATLTGQPLRVGKRATRFPSLDETLAAVPNEFDAIVSIDYTQMPFVREMAWLGRRFGLEMSLADMREAGGAVGDSTLAGAQLMADSVTMIFFQLGYYLGNLRIGRVTATVHAARGEKAPNTWVRVDGHFDARRILALLGQSGFEVTGEIAKMKDLSVRVTSRFIESQDASYDMRKTGKRAGELKAMGLNGQNVVFAKLGKMRRLATLTGVPFTEYDGVRLTGQVAGRKVSLQLQCTNHAQAKGILNLIELSETQVRQGIKQEGKFDLEAIEALYFPKIVLDEDDPVLSVEWDGTQLTYAKALRAVGILGGVSRQDGPP